MTTMIYNTRLKELKNKLQRVALWMLPREQDADDMVQDVMLKLTEKQKFMESLEHFEAYSIKMLKNRCLDFLKRKTVIYMPTDELEYTSTLSPDKIFEQQEKLRITRKIISELPESQKIAMELRHIEGYELIEIAEILDLEVNHTRVLLTRARKKLTEELTKVYHYDEL